MTGGLFATVARGKPAPAVNAAERGLRNPIFSGMLLAAFGFALLVPNVLTRVVRVALVALVVAVQLQVRVVEEPYPVRTHGETYRANAARAGRFVPGVGRLA